MDKLKSLREVADYIISSGIEMVNFMYPAADGRLKTLNFTVNDEDYLLSVLRYGERVDGSSLFPFIEAGNSDLYVIPRLKTMADGLLPVCVSRQERPQARLLPRIYPAEGPRRVPAQDRHGLRGHGRA